MVGSRWPGGTLGTSDANSPERADTGTLRAEDDPSEPGVEVLEARLADPVLAVVRRVALKLRARIVLKDVVSEVDPTEGTMVMIPVASRIRWPTRGPRPPVQLTMLVRQPPVSIAGHDHQSARTSGATSSYWRDPGWGSLERPDLLDLIARDLRQDDNDPLRVSWSRASNQEVTLLLVRHVGEHREEMVPALDAVPVGPNLDHGAAPQGDTPPGQSADHFHELSVTRSAGAAGPDQARGHLSADDWRASNQWRDSIRVDASSFAAFAVT